MKHKVVINNCFGGFGLSPQGEKMFAELKGIKDLSRVGAVVYNTPRHDKDLLKVVEELGEKANDEYSELIIVEFEGNEYLIDEYDGAESVITPNDMVWIKIKD